MSQAKHDYFAPDTFGRAVQDSLGDDVMLRLRTQLGGQEVRFPKSSCVLLDEHWLVVAMGRVDAERLCAVFGDETIYIPKPLKDRRYRELIEEGLTQREIALRVGLSARQVRRDLNALNLTANRRPRARMAIHPDRAEQIAARSALIAAEYA